MSWWYQDRISAGECRFTAVEVQLELKYTYPRWRPPSPVSRALPGEWRRYLSALHTHENGHGAIAIAVSRQVLAGIRELAPRPSCQRLTAAADALGASGLERMNGLEQAYDARTNHGATQGARFP